jgi:hypothetical protein
MPKGEKTNLLWKNKEYREKMVKVHQGKKQSEETIEKRVLHFRNEKHHNWKGDEVSYNGLHKWLNRKLGKPDTCEFCGKTGLTGKEINWANKSHKYNRNLNDWLRLCSSCHKKYDLLLNLKQKQYV